MAYKKNIQVFTNLIVKGATLITPALSIFLILYSSFFGYLDRSKNYIAHSTSILFAVINASKSLFSQGDFSAYEKIYISINKVSLFEALIESEKDPLFYSIFWIFSKLFSFEIVIGLITYISFLLLFKAAYKFKVKNAGILIFISLIFSWPIFSLSAHIIRQFLCMAFLFYAISKAENNEKTFIYPLFLSGLIHTSSFLLIIIVLLFYFKLTLSFLKKIYYLPLLAIFFISPQIDNLLFRFAEESINDGSELRTDGYFFSIFNIIISFLGFVYKKNKFIALYLLYSIICLLILFYLNPFLYGRFSFYNYLFFAYFVSKFCNRYVIVGFLFLIILSLDTIFKLNSKGYIFDIDWYNLIFSWI